MLGEHEYTVHPLTLPEQTVPYRAESLVSIDAISLFVQRAQTVKHDFALEDENAAAIVEVCHAVGGLPLALELAAAWVRVLPCAEIAFQIAQSLDLLSTAYSNVPERHRSLRAVFNQSWSLLSADEQAAFRRLAVFRGDFSQAAAADVAGVSVFVLAALIEKSLLHRGHGDSYIVHELLRQYATEKLNEAGEMEATRNRHLTYYVALAETAKSGLTNAPHMMWFDVLEREIGNLRAAMEWSRAAPERVELGLRLAASVGNFLRARNLTTEGRTWLAAARDPAGGGNAVRAKALGWSGSLAWEQADYQTARADLAESRTLYRGLGDPPEQP